MARHRASEPEEIDLEAAWEALPRPLRLGSRPPGRLASQRAAYDAERAAWCAERAIPPDDLTAYELHRFPTPERTD